LTEEPWAEYTPEFYALHHDNSHLAAYRTIARALWVLLGMDPSWTIVDAGCGTGGLLAAFEAQGSTVFAGIEAYQRSKEIRTAGLRIPETQVLWLDLAEPLPAVVRGYRLAICVEVAEHLPEESAEQLVKNLTQLSGLVVFSAAHPGQGGTGHINERDIQDWVALFDQAGYSYNVPETVELRCRLDGHVRELVWYEQLVVFRRR
jgi:2-polyprenyl-3-methyl-5-hydroxy-6-metoxy-1,4-benzoquinol methylase